MDEETITIPLRVWNELHEELNKLRKENQFLKHNQLTMSYSPQLPLQTHPLKHKNSYGGGTSSSSPKGVSKVELKKQMSEWSKKMKSIYYKCFDVVDEGEEHEQQRNPAQEVPIEKKNKGSSEESDEIAISIPSDNEPTEQFAILEEQATYMKEAQKSLKLIEAICFYGPSIKETQQLKHQKRSYVPFSLLFCSNPALYKQYLSYGNYFYPEQQVKAKRVRQEETLTHINRIIFKKNTKKQQCLAFMFCKDEENDLLRDRNQLMEKVNPGKWLVSFCVHFTDFITFSNDGLEEGEEEKESRSFGQSSGKVNSKNDGEQVSPEPQNRSVGLTKSTILMHNKPMVVVSKFTLAIFTYFPFVSIIEKILISMLEEIKTQRMSAYAEESANIQPINYQFVLNNIIEISKRINIQLAELPPQIGVSGSVVVSEQSDVITIDLCEENLLGYFYEGWAYQLLKNYDKDKIYEIFCDIMLEKSVVFVCQDLHLLTYVIMMFVLGLPRPFYYPYPCISVLFNLEFLQSPITLTAGINSSYKRLKESIHGFDQRIIFVDLNKQSEIQIYGKKLGSTGKSQKLRKVFGEFFKKVDTPLFKKKEKIIKSTTKKQNVLFYDLVKGISDYFHKEVINYLPKKQVIQCWQINLNERKEEESKISVLRKMILKYLHSSRKGLEATLSPLNPNKSLQNFLVLEYEDSLLHKQKQSKDNKDNLGQGFIYTLIFSVFLTEYYGFS